MKIMGIFLGGVIRRKSNRVFERYYKIFESSSIKIENLLSVFFCIFQFFFAFSTCAFFSSNFDPQEFFSKEGKKTHKFHLRQCSKLVAKKVEIGHRSTQKSKTDIVRLKNRKRTSLHSKRLG